MKRIAMLVAAMMAMACGGAQPVNHSNEAMFGTAADGSLECGTWAAPGSVTPSCSSPTSCACDFTCVENPAGGKAALHAEFSKPSATWRVTTTAYGSGC